MTRLRTLTIAAAAVAAAGGITAAVPEPSTRDVAARPGAAVAVTGDTAVARVSVAPVADVRERRGGGGSMAAPRHGAPAVARPAAARPARRHAAPAAPYGEVRWDGKPFATPEDAMRFLARAYNVGDETALRHVTTPDARRDLDAMRDLAPTITLTRCTALPSGAHDCAFTHSYVTGGPEGAATFRVAPARKPGWYMTVLEECG